ncbi:tripartite tricarboxylate transporter TctB family protein [Primorskyibacter sp. 2E107]|uniref:tripartite tricarboxylate transporter TctB family protein n=1 Tax=Primorskyibacter sp. 2E107 TaxID=3403458 RepID=UPI003AF72050
MAEHLRRNDLVCGAAVALLGVFALVSALGWDFGSMRRIGPALFPAGIGLILIVLGLAIAIFEGRSGPLDPDDMPARLNLRSLLLIVAGLAAFTALIRTAGLIPAIWVAVFLSAWADPAARFRDSAIVAAVMSSIAMGLFVHLLGFQARAFGAY